MLVNYLRFLVVVVLILASFGLYKLIEGGWFYNASFMTIIMFLVLVVSFVFAIFGIVNSGILSKPKKEKK